MAKPNFRAIHSFFTAGIKSFSRMYKVVCTSSGSSKWGVEKEPFTRKYGVRAGYYFAEVNEVPEIDEASKIVDINYFANPGEVSHCPPY